MIEDSTKLPDGTDRAILGVLNPDEPAPDVDQGLIELAARCGSISLARLARAIEKTIPQR